MRKTLAQFRLPLAVSLVVIVIAVFGDTGREALQYQHGGEVYRWLTGHFTHIGWRHVGLNLMGLFGVWALYYRVMSEARWIIFLLICPLSISIGFNLFSADTTYYVGLSGVLHGMLAAALTLTLFRSIPQNGFKSTLTQKWEEIIVLMGLWGKVAYEQIIGAVPLTAAMAGDAVVVDSHLYGAVIGTAFAVLLTLRKVTALPFR